MKSKKIISLAIASAVVLIIIFSLVILFANDGKKEKGELVNASTQEGVAVEISKDAYENTTPNGQVANKDASSTHLASEQAVIDNETPTADKNENKPHPRVPEEAKATTTPHKPTAVVTEETQTTLPWGTANDFSVQNVASASNAYVATFDGVVIDESLDVDNACWTLYVSSYAYESESALLADIKETARFQYEQCVEGGNLNYNVPLRMYVKAVPNFNEKLNATYYHFYILHMV